MEAELLWIDEDILLKVCSLLYMLTSLTYTMAISERIHASSRHMVQWSWGKAKAKALPCLWNSVGNGSHPSRFSNESDQKVRVQSGFWGLSGWADGKTFRTGFLDLEFFTTWRDRENEKERQIERVREREKERVRERVAGKELVRNWTTEIGESGRGRRVLSG